MSHNILFRRTARHYKAQLIRPTMSIYLTGWAIMQLSVFLCVSVSVCERLCVCVCACFCRLWRIL